ncbi:MAG: ribonuclease HII [Cyanobacteria bacterium Co-bin13]|nr:ribonuclease HII [Cyanobacteria bacterium Co-bin13]
MTDLAQGTCIAGVDEVGRGALFGPVVAAAVILSDASACELISLGVRDSKQLSPVRRQVIAVAIRQLAADCRIGLASVREIDRLNILQASLLAMKRAILQLAPAPTLCLIDGNQRVPNLPMSQQTIVKGDQQNCAIAAASILAKVWRDTLITRLDGRYPGYDLAANKGYGSLKHRQALAMLGPSPQHRLSFRTCQVAAAAPKQLLLLPKNDH